MGIINAILSTVGLAQRNEVNQTVDHAVKSAIEEYKKEEYSRRVYVATKREDPYYWPIEQVIVHLSLYIDKDRWAYLKKLNPEEDGLYISGNEDVDIKFRDRIELPLNEVIKIVKCFEIVKVNSAVEGCNEYGVLEKLSASSNPKIDFTVSNLMNEVYSFYKNYTLPALMLSDEERQHIQNEVSFYNKVMNGDRMSSKMSIRRQELLNTKPKHSRPIYGCGYYCNNAPNYTNEYDYFNQKYLPSAPPPE